MHIVLDTSIILQDPKMSGLKMTALFSYLEKMKDKLVLPEIVVEEAAAHVGRELQSAADMVADAAEILRRSSALDSMVAPLRLNISDEVAAYKRFLLEPRPHRISLVLQSEPLEDLPEMVRRLVERRKPASHSGREARDVLIWLALKRHVAKSQASVVFISANTSDFAASKEGGLAPELASELSESTGLHYYASLDSFLKSEASKVEFVTAAWIKEHLNSPTIEQLIERTVDGGGPKAWQHLENRFEEEIDGTPVLASIDVGLDDFYVVDVDSDGLYLNLAYSGEVEFEVELRGYGEDRWARSRPRTVTSTIELTLSAQATPEGITNTEVDDWYLSS